MKSFYVRMKVPVGTGAETREALSRLLVGVASRFDFQGLEDWAVDLASGTKVLGAEREFYDLRTKGPMSPELNAYFGSKKGAQDFRELVGRLISDLPVAAPRPLGKKDWMKEWRRHYRTQRLEAGGHRLAVVPAWKKAPARGLSLRIYPGQAFGTGTHATTRLCLQAVMEGWHPGIGRVLDFGAGTGVLALGALALAADQRQRVLVAAVESDPEALAQCRKNFRLNRRVAKFSLKQPPGKFDLIVANVLSPVLLAHRKKLVGAMSQNGKLVLSGILAAEAAKFAREFAKGLPVRQARQLREGDWAALEFRRK